MQIIIININKTYSWDINYDINFIESIELYTHIPYLKSIEYDLFQDTLGSKETGSRIKQLILLARENYISKSQTYFEDIKIQVDYISETGNEIIINLDTDNAEDISNFKEEIKNQKKYMMYTAKDQSNPRNKFIIKIRPDE